MYCRILLIFSVPAPLYYNDDSTIDLLVRVNVGHWMAYNSSYMAVLDGRNGRELWTLDSVSTGMMSGLSLAAAGSPGHDGMMFITIGREAPIDLGAILNDVLGKEFGGGKRHSSDDRTCHVYYDDLCLWDDHKREKRHGGDTSDEEEEEEGSELSASDGGSLGTRLYNWYCSRLTASDGGSLGTRLYNWYCSRLTASDGGSLGTRLYSTVPGLLQVMGEAWGRGYIVLFQAYCK